MCNICDFTTKWNYSLMRHTRLKHGQGPSCGHTDAGHSTVSTFKLYVLGMKVF